jgi:hypothetical protein
MQTLREVLVQAQEKGAAIGHFNIADVVLLKAVFTSAQELNVPVMVGASDGEREFMGVRQIALPCARFAGPPLRGSRRTRHNQARCPWWRDGSSSVVQELEIG